MVHWILPHGDEAIDIAIRQFHPRAELGAPLPLEEATKDWENPTPVDPDDPWDRHLQNIRPNWRDLADVCPYDRVPGWEKIDPP